MKKITAGLLALMMAVGSVSALAEQGGESGSDPAGTAIRTEETEIIGEAEETAGEAPAEEAAEAGNAEEPAGAAETGTAEETAEAAETGTEEETTGTTEAEKAEKNTAAEEPAAVSSVTPPETFRLLQNGSRGEDVVKLQQRLIELGYYSGAADGIYGRGTRSAVREFQKRNSLSVDGVAGKQTQARLYSAEAIEAPGAPEPTDTLAGEWPMLVNAAYPVGESFLPTDLVLMKNVCDSSLIKIKYASTQAVRQAVEALVTMLEAARRDGITKWQCSAAYRSYTDQEKMLNNKIRSYQNRNASWSRSRARRAALNTVAEPGASEHHLGLSFDINVPGTSAFAGTKQYTWLHEHCWEYGFIVRYQEGKEEITGFAPEAWHIRYVGTAHSLIMRDENLCLEEYLQKYYPQALTKPEQPAETAAPEAEGENATQSGETETGESTAAETGEETPELSSSGEEEFDPGFFEPTDGLTEQGLIEELQQGEFDEEGEG